MRKLMWFTIGFGAACAFGAYFYVPWFLSAAVGCAIGAGLLLVAANWIRPCRIAAAVCFGLAVGFCWFHLYDTLYLGEARAADENSGEVTVIVRDYSYETDYGGAFDGAIELGERTYQVRVYLNEYEGLKPGDRVEGTFRFRLTTSGGVEEVLYHRGQGIFLLAYQSGDYVVRHYFTTAWKDYPAIWRQKLQEKIDSTFPEDAAGFAKALLLGDKTGIDYETSTAFKVSGISHIIAVSGLHVSILFGLVYLLSGRRRVLTALIGIPAVLIFAAIVGFTPSVTRASLMQIVLMVSMLFEKEYDPPSALSFAALVMLILNPLVISSVSFQLSFACMAGIFLFAEPIRRWLMDPKRLGKWKGKLTNWLASSVSVSLSATVMTTPLAAVHFGTVSLVGALTNLLTLWVITFIFYGIMAVCLLGFLDLRLAELFASIVAWPIRYVLAAAKLLASFPLAAVYTKSIYIVIWLIFAYGMLIIFLCIKKKPAALFAGLISASLCLAVGFSWAEPLLGEGRFTMLDVGQGQALLLQSGGKTFLVDCGGDYSQDAADITAETLLSQGIDRLDGIILTHYDADHAGGMEYLLTRIDTDLLLMPHSLDEGGVGEKLAALVPDGTKTIAEDLILSYDEVQLTVYAPFSYNSGNESSLCVLFQTENCDILITGDRSQDGEGLLLKYHELPQLDVLVAGHHGSKYSTSQALLEATQPQYAFISVGADNSYGHPTQEVLDRLREFGCMIYRTDLNGTICYRW